MKLLRERETDTAFPKHGFIVFGIKSFWRTSVHRSLSGLHLFSRRRRCFPSDSPRPLLVMFLGKAHVPQKLGIHLLQETQALKPQEPNTNRLKLELSFTQNPRGNPLITAMNHELTCYWVCDPYKLNTTCTSVAVTGLSDHHALHQNITGRSELKRIWGTFHSQINTGPVLGLIWFSFDWQACDSIHYRFIWTQQVQYMNLKNFK